MPSPKEGLCSVCDNVIVQEGTISICLFMGILCGSSCFVRQPAKGEQEAQPPSLQNVQNRNVQEGNLKGLEW